jgi:hypothetical protein
MRDIDTYDQPAYAIEDTKTETNRIWRATYKQSNAAADIVVTLNKSEGIGGWAASTFPLHIPPGYSVLIGIILALLVWLIAWRYIIPRRIPVVKYSWKEGRMWGEALIYPAINLGLAIVCFPVAMFLMFIAAFILGSIAGIWLPVAIVVIATTAVFLSLPAKYFIDHFQAISAQSKTRLFVTFLFVVLAANAAYIAVGAIYTAITSAI